VLQWTGAPADAQSFAVTVYDPDAPTGSGWWHWLVVDLPAGTSELSANAGAKGSRTCRWRAPDAQRLRCLCLGRHVPLPGDKPHRYIFTVHALSVPKLDIPDDATAALTGFMVNATTIAKASFTSTYARPA
jgi:Raf kinase inhibitor-like YbhB/YbcL family protein